MGQKANVENSREKKYILFHVIFPYNPRKQLSFFMAKRDKNSIHFDFMFFAQWIVIFISFQHHSFPVLQVKALRKQHIKLSSYISSNSKPQNSTELYYLNSA